MPAMRNAACLGERRYLRIEMDSLRRSSNGFTVTCPHCRTRFLIGGYMPGLIACGKCGKTINLK